MTNESNSQIAAYVLEGLRTGITENPNRFFGGKWFGRCACFIGFALIGKYGSYGKARKAFKRHVSRNGYAIAASLLGTTYETVKILSDRHQRGDETAKEIAESLISWEEALTVPEEPSQMTPEELGHHILHALDVMGLEEGEMYYGHDSRSSCPLGLAVRSVYGDVEGVKKMAKGYGVNAAARDLNIDLDLAVSVSATHHRCARHGKYMAREIAIALIDSNDPKALGDMFKNYLNYL